MEPPLLIYTVGSPGRGKSVEIQDIFYTLAKERKVSYGIVICPTIYNGAYNFIPSEYQYATYDEDVIRKLMIGQKQLSRNNTVKNAFIIFDDCIGNAEWKSNLMQELITTHRHLKLTIVIASQYCYSIPPLIRSCANLAIIFKPPNERSYKCLLDTFFLDYDNVKDLKNEFEKLEKFEFIRVWCNKDISDGKYETDKAELRTFKLTY